MSLFHIHYDRDWQMDGSNALYECRCGARRVRRMYTGVYTVSSGWPRLVDRHGRGVMDTGWVKPS